MSETVGLPLFEQVGKRIYLTDAGRRVHEGCNDVFRALAHLEETLSEMRGLDSGHLRLAVSTTAKYFAPRLLAAFAQCHTGIETSLQIHNRSTLTERLGRNEDDLYLFVDPPDGQEVVVQTILSDPLEVFARSDHPLVGEKDISFARLADEPFLMREHGSGTRRVASMLFERHRLTPKIRMELSTDDLLRRSVIQRLACDFRLTLKNFEAAYNIDFRRYFKAEMADLARLAEDGLVELVDDGVVVTPKGRVLVRAVCMVFDRYLREKRSGATYSKVL